MATTPDLNEALTRMGEINENISKRTDGAIASSTKASEAAQRAEEAAQRAEDLTKDIPKYGEEITSLKTRFEELGLEPADVEDLNKRLQQLETEFTRHARTPESGVQQRAGDLFIESDVYESIRSGKSKTGTFKFKRSAMPRTPESRSALTSVDSDGGRLGSVLREQEVVTALDTLTSIVDVVPRVTISEMNVDFIREVQPMKLVDEIQGAVVATDTTLVVKNAAAFVNGTKIVVGSETRTISNINRATNTLTVDAFVSGHAAGTEVTAEFFAYTAEAELKPELQAEFKEESKRLEVIAGWIPVSNRMFKSSPVIIDHIETMLPEKVRQASAYQYWYGDGEQGNQLGFMNDTDIPEYLWSNGKAGDTKRDAIRRGMTVLMKRGVMPSHVFLSPNDLEDVELAKDNTGQYIMGLSYTNNAGQRMIWNVRVMVDGYLKTGDFLIGDMNQARVYEFEDMDLRLAEQHADFFVKNLSVLLAEGYEALTIRQPGAFVRGSFDAEP